MDTLLKSCENILILLCLSLKYPPCYKDMSFWISESFTENNLCEVVRGIAGDLVEEVHLLNNLAELLSDIKTFVCICN